MQGPPGNSQEDVPPDHTHPADGGGGGRGGGGGIQPEGGGGAAGMTWKLTKEYFLRCGFTAAIPKKILEESLKLRKEEGADEGGTTKNRRRTPTGKEVLTKCHFLFVFDFFFKKKQNFRQKKRKKIFAAWNFSARSSRVFVFLEEVSKFVCVAQRKSSAEKEGKRVGNFVFIPFFFPKR